MSNLRQLKVNFDSFDDLIESIGPGLSRTRLVIPSSVLRSVDSVDDTVGEGTRVRLEMGTVRRGALIRGVAKVAAGDDAYEQDLPLHVIHLDPSSTRLVDSIVRGEVWEDEEPEPSGQSPFDIPAAEPEMAVEPRILAAGDILPSASRPRRSVWPIAVCALVAALGVCFLLFRPSEGGRSRTSGDSQAEMADPAVKFGSGAEPVTTGEVKPGKASVANQSATEDALSLEREPLSSEAAVDEVEVTVRAWADAWGRQAPDVYLDFYVPDYSPDGLTREAWESQRRSRITAPKQLDIRIDELEIQRLDQDRAIASFQQLYATEKKALLARKVLELERLEGEWKIAAEQLSNDH